MVKNKKKEELISSLKQSHPLTLELEKVKKKYYRKNKPHWLLFAYPFLVALIVYPIRDFIPSEILTGPYFYIPVLLGWLGVFYLHIPLIGRNLKKEAEAKREIEKEFTRITGMHRNLCNQLKVELMLEALENGEANNYREALLYTDRKYKDILVSADRF